MRKNAIFAQNSLSLLQEARNELFFGTLPFFNARNPKMQEFLRFEISLTIVQCDFYALNAHPANSEISFSGQKFNRIQIPRYQKR